MKNLFPLASASVKLAFSGRSSVEMYAVMGRDEKPVVFTDRLDRFLEAWGDRVQGTSRFIDFELQETDDPTVYFDLRVKQGLPYASPVQVLLECSSGDKRERETAGQVREAILRELQT